MKNQHLLRRSVCVFGAVLLAAASVCAQPMGRGPGPGGPPGAQFPRAMERLFGEHKAFSATVEFKDVKFDKPDAALFQPPSGAKKYNSVMDLMTSRIGGAKP